MRKVFVCMVCATIVLSGCGTYAGSGAYTGAHLGSILGSAIGGVTDGYRGYHLGTVVGMAGGAIVGAAVGSAADNAKKKEVRDHYQNEVKPNMKKNKQSYDDENAYFDPSNGGDDRLYDFQGEDYTDNYSASSAQVKSPSASSIEDLSSGYEVNTQLEIRNPRFVDDNRDGYLSSNETCKVIFEVYNTSDQTLYDLQPSVIQSSGLKNVYVSPSIHVEHLDPGKGIRYTAMVKTGKVKNGLATFCLSVLQGNRVMSNVTEFTVSTRR